jgi:hypothetical protein
LRNDAFVRTPFKSAVALLVLRLSAPVSCADPNVVVSAFANPEYTKEKYEGEKIRAESYVVMQGQYFENTTVDNSIDRMPFRRILDIFAPELARRQYWPAKNSADADLLIVVHWGTTSRQVSSDEMRARESKVTDMSENGDVLVHNNLLAQAGATNQDAMGIALSAYDPIAYQRQLDVLDQVVDQVRTDYGMANNAQLLGYTKELRKLSVGFVNSTSETMLRSDMASERYFIILKAYDLHQKIAPGGKRQSVWTLHLNMRSPGTNFRAALDRMSATAVDYFGRGTDQVTTVRPHEREGHVEVGTPVIVSEKKK